MLPKVIGGPGGCLGLGAIQPRAFAQTVAITVALSWNHFVSRRHQIDRSGEFWRLQEWQDLNLRPPRPERGALPDCAHSDWRPVYSGAPKGGQAWRSAPIRAVLGGKLASPPSRLGNEEAGMGYTFTLSEIIPAPPAAIYDAWVNSRAHSAMTGSKATQSPRVGANVSAWDGYISGKNLELVPASASCSPGARPSSPTPIRIRKSRSRCGRWRAARASSCVTATCRAGRRATRKAAGRRTTSYQCRPIHQGRRASRAQICRDQEANRQGQGRPRQGTGDARQNGEPGESRNARQDQRPQARKEPQSASAQDAPTGAAAVNRAVR